MMSFRLDIVSNQGDFWDMTTDKGKPAGQETAKTPADDGFVDVVTDRTMYKADTCKDTPLTGYLINKIPMPAIRGREWSAFVVRTTAPVKTEDREGNVTTVPQGSEVLVPATFALESALSRAAIAALVHEVRISPLKKIDVGAGQTMWTYTIQAKPGGIPRGKFGFSAMLGAAPEVPQLTTGETTDNIPF
jgi:hypothetical protein